MWALQAVICEINAWPWLTHLERKYKRKLGLQFSRQAVCESLLVQV